MAVDPIPTDIETEIERLKCELVRMVLFELRADDDSQIVALRSEIATAIGHEVAAQLGSAVPQSNLAAAGSALADASSQAIVLCAQLATIRNAAAAADEQATRLSGPLNVIRGEIDAIARQLDALKRQAGHLQVVHPTAGDSFAATAAPPAEPDQPVDIRTLPSALPGGTPPLAGRRWLHRHWRTCAEAAGLIMAFLVIAYFAAGPSQKIVAQPATNQVARNLAGTLLATGALLDERIRVAGAPDVSDIDRPIGAPMTRVSARNLAESLNEVASTATGLAGSLRQTDPQVHKLEELADQLSQLSDEVRGFAESGASNAKWSPGDLLAITTGLRGFAERQLALRIEPVAANEIPVEATPSPTSTSGSSRAPPGDGG